MAPSRVGVATTQNPWGTLVGSTGSPQSYTQAQPVGTQVGDLMVAFLGWAQNGGQTWSVVEGGWTAIPNFMAQLLVPSGTSAYMSWAYRFKQPGDPSSWTFRMTYTSGVNNCHVGGILSYRGISNYSVLTGAGGGGTPASHSAAGGVFPWNDADTGNLVISSPSRGVGVQGVELFICAAFSLDPPTTVVVLTEPSGMTKRIDIRHTSPSFKLFVWDEFVAPGVSWASKTARMTFNTSDDYAVIFDGLWPQSDQGIVDDIVAAFSATPTTGAEPLSVDFTDESEGEPGPDTWLWDFGDGATSTAQNPTHVYADDGTYDVSLHIERG